MNTSSTENVSFSQPAFSSQCNLIKEAATREIRAMCTQVVFNERVSPYPFNRRVSSTNSGDWFLRFEGSFCEPECPMTHPDIHWAPNVVGRG